MLNKAIVRELQVANQYIWPHVQWRGVKGFAVKDELKSIAITEMKHAEVIAERLFYLGEIPTTKPPTNEELRILRTEVDPLGILRLEEPYG